MELFQLYIRQRIKGIAAVFLFTGLFAVSFFLYHLPVEAVLYPASLCILLSIFFILTDFVRVRKKHLRLLEVRKLNAAMISSLPETETVEDRDYQDIIRALQTETLRLETTSGTDYQNMVDYYTLWVHQIKTPIASMKLSLQTEDTPLSRKLSSDLFRIEQYVEMVLAYLRLDFASGDYVFRKHSIDSIIKDAVRKFASEFITRKIHLEYQPSEQTVITDEKWLSFVVEQIISNALKYTRQDGCVKIYIDEPKTLCIEDNGIGIAPEDLPRIFEKGYTGYNGHADKRASGIGLYLCRRICRNLGADITVLSEPDKGTTVRINLEEYQLRAE